MYDFSKMTNRFNTNSYKWDVKENELPMIDFAKLQKMFDVNVM